MMDWEKVEDILAETDTIALLTEEIPKDGIETKISIIHPETLENLIEDTIDIYQLYDKIREDYTITTQIHLTNTKTIEIYRSLR